MHVIICISIPLYTYSANIRNCYCSQCTDNDECLDDSPCDANATCTNTLGSFDCSCNTGYDGDGVTCISELEIYNSFFWVGNCIFIDYTRL